MLNGDPPVSTHFTDGSKITRSMPRIQSMDVSWNFFLTAENHSEFVIRMMCAYRTSTKIVTNFVRFCARL